MFDHFNAQARQAIGDAEAVAHRLAHHYIGTEHLLVGLASGAASGAQRALERFGLDAGRLEQQVEQLLGRGQQPLLVRPPFTTSTTLALQRSRWEARQLGDDEVATSHLLLGLVRIPHSTASTVLRGLGVEPAQLEAAVLLVADHDGPLGETGGSGAAVPAPGRTAAPADRPGTTGAELPPADEPLAIQLGRLSREVRDLREEVARLSRLVSGPAPVPTPLPPTPEGEPA